MAQTLTSNLVGLTEQLPAEMIEKQATQFDLINAASNGTLLLNTGETLGQQELSSIWAANTTVARRDITSSSAYSTNALTQTAIYKPVLSRKQRVNLAISALRNMGVDPQALTAGLIADKLVQDEVYIALSSMLAGIVGCTTKAATTYLNKTALSSSYSISATYCMDAIALLGDHARDVSAIVMHSTPANTLRQAAVGTISTNQWLSGVGGFTADALLSSIVGKPVLVTDNSVLTYAVSSSVTGYRTLFLTAGAASMTRRVTLPVEAWVERNLENASINVDGEYEEKLHVKGFSYNDYANANPTDSTLATASKWTQAVASVKYGPGAVLLTK